MTQVMVVRSFPTEPTRNSNQLTPVDEFEQKGLPKRVVGSYDTAKMGKATPKPVEAWNKIGPTT